MLKGKYPQFISQNHALTKFWFKICNNFTAEQRNSFDGGVGPVFL